MRSTNVRVLVVTVIVSALLMLGAAPAFAGGTVSPPTNGVCQIPRGQITGWEPCGGGCYNPPGNRTGWEPCGTGDCENPTGLHLGWVNCGQKNGCPK